MKTTHLLLLALLAIAFITNSNAFAQKDCSQTKSMAELKTCDPAQYESAQKTLFGAQSTLNNYYASQANTNAAMQKNVNDLHAINEELRKTLEQAKQWNSGH